MKKYRNLLLNIGDALVVVFVIVSLLLLFLVGFPGSGGSMAIADISALKYYTVESNILMGVISLITLIYRLLTKKKIPFALVIIKFILVTAVMVTFLTVMFYLLPYMQDAMLVTYSNIFLHILTPLLACFIFMVLEDKNEKFRFVHTFYAMTSVGLYTVYYMTNLIIHNGYGNPDYDWYGFGRFGLPMGIVSAVIMMVACWGISLLIYLGYRKIKIE